MQETPTMLKSTDIISGRFIYHLWKRNNWIQKWRTLLYRKLFFWIGCNVFL
jgi:hypothetical protein